MQENEIKELLEKVKTGDRSVDDALKALKDIPYHEMGFANVDHHRALRTGFPEAIFGQGKSAAQISAIMTELLSKGGTIMATRLEAEKAEAVRKDLPEAIYYKDAKILAAGSGLSGKEDEDAAKLRRQKTVAVVSAGTADIPIAEEAAVTAELLGNEVHRVYDVGVAGIHRVFSKLDIIRSCNVAIVVAGMEGALASVVGGLVDTARWIAVPLPAWGYGANLGGITTLLSMLDSCANGIGVVNIDNGYGAAYLASVINRSICGKHFTTIKAECIIKHCKKLSV